LLVSVNGCFLADDCKFITAPGALQIDGNLFSKERRCPKMKAIILVKIATGEVQETFHFLKKLRCVSEAYITFGPYDAVVILEASNLAEVGRIVACDIQPIPGVSQTLTCLATEVWQPVQPVK
jgi:DNA-binding Lrp family transcriptional regulator